MNEGPSVMHWLIQVVTWGGGGRRRWVLRQGDVLSTMGVVNAGCIKRGCDMEGYISEIYVTNITRVCDIYQKDV